jgi:hypothetical protein
MGTPGPPTDLFPDFEMLGAAREYCAEASFSLGTGERDEAIMHLIRAVDHMIAAWQQ